MFQNASKICLTHQMQNQPIPNVNTTVTHKHLNNFITNLTQVCQKACAISVWTFLILEAQF